MTNLAAGNHTRGQLAEQAIQDTEAAITRRPKVPASSLLNSIARDALAAVLRDDTAAIESLPMQVNFRAAAVKSRRHPGQWRLLIVAKSCGAWGHCMSGPMSCEAFVRGMAEMINGPAATSANSAEAVNGPLSPSKVSWPTSLGVLGVLLSAMRGRGGIARSNHLSAAGDLPPFVRVQVHQQSKPAAGGLDCASLPAVLF